MIKKVKALPDICLGFDQKYMNSDIIKIAAERFLNICTDKKVKIVALSDRIANLRAINRDYITFGECFWNRFNQKNPAELKWYYSSFLDTCKELSDTQAYKEYAELIGKAFGKY